MMMMRFEWVTDMTQPDRPPWQGEMSAVPSVGDHITIYGSAKDEDGFHEPLAAGYVKAVLWGLYEDRTSDVLVRLQ